MLQRLIVGLSFLMQGAFGLQAQSSSMQSGSQSSSSQQQYGTQSPDSPAFLLRIADWNFVLFYAE